MAWFYSATTAALAAFTGLFLLRRVYVMEFGDSSSRLYTYNNFSSEFNFNVFRIDENGIHLERTVRSEKGSFDPDYEGELRHAWGNILTSWGQTVDLDEPAFKGRFPVFGLPCPDPESDRVYFLTYTDGFSIEAFDRWTFRRTARGPVTADPLPPGQLMRLRDGLIFRNWNEIVWTPLSALVPEPEP